VNVHNQIFGPEEPTSIHWHGLNQPGTPYYDGVVTVSQCPIVPGSNLTYRFRADEYGTSWWHAHYSAQYSSGVVGPIVIHGPNDATYDVDVYPILVSDWFHDTYVDIVNLVMSPSSSGQPFRPFSDSNLVAGAGQYPCANVTNGAPCTVTPYASWEFEPGKTYRLRFVNTGASAFESISIDGHTLTVIANDFVPVVPYQTQSITIGVGQRTDVLVTANQAPGSYWLRAFNTPCGDTNGPDGRGIIYYTGSDPSVAPTSTASAPGAINSNCQNDPLATTVPQYAIPAVAAADTTITVTIAGAPDSSGVFHWTMNGVSYEGDLANPILPQALAGTTNFPASYNVYNTGAVNTVRLIIINTTPAPHPMHMHGHDFQVLAEGFGTWDGTITNPSNPQRRDVHMLWAGASPSNPSYIVLQYTQDNPGVWPVHCHIAWHLSAGMVIMLLEHPEEFSTLQLPDSISQTCPAYTAWYAANPVPVEDALRRRDHAAHLDKHRKRGVSGFRGYGHGATFEEFPDHGRFKGNATQEAVAHESPKSTSKPSPVPKASSSWLTHSRPSSVQSNLVRPSSSGKGGRKRDEV
jgi:FtsP/CotA-like multicopper oxidase with cupredoxin domain